MKVYEKCEIQIIPLENDVIVCSGGGNNELPEEDLLKDLRNSPLT